MIIEIEIDSYTFFIVIHNYYKGYPAKTWGKPEDCYEGVDEEIEWSCVCVKEYFEDGSVEETTVDIDQYAELIEEKIFDKLREMKQYSEEYY